MASILRSEGNPDSGGEAVSQAQWQPWKQVETVGKGKGSRPLSAVLSTGGGGEAQLHEGDTAGDPRASPRHHPFPQGASFERRGSAGTSWRRRG